MSITAPELTPLYQPQTIDADLEIPSKDRFQRQQEYGNFPHSYTFDYLRANQDELLGAMDVTEACYESEPVIAACRNYMKNQDDEDTVMHCDRTAIATVILAKRMGLPDEEVRLGVIAAACHDVGRSTPEIRPLVKTNLDFRKLSADERAHYMKVIDWHTEIGAKMIQSVAGNDVDDKAVAQMVAAHHAVTKDKPHGKVPQDHKTVTEILAFADELDALASTRSYKPAKSKAETRQILEGQFSGDPRIIKSCFGYN